MSTRATASTAVKSGKSKMTAAKAKETRAKAARQKESRSRQEAFGRALAEAMTMRGVTQLELGDQLGLTQSAVSSWRVADAVPDTEVVFAVERALNLPPGQLSRHLGYFPPAAVKGGGTVEEAVLANTVLDEAGKRAVLAVFRELTTRASARRGRPPKSSAR